MTSRGAQTEPPPLSFRFRKETTCITPTRMGPLAMKVALFIGFLFFSSRVSKRVTSTHTHSSICLMFACLNHGYEMGTCLFPFPVENGSIWAGERKGVYVALRALELNDHTCRSVLERSTFPTPTRMDAIVSSCHEGSIVFLFSFFFFFQAVFQNVLHQYVVINATD